MPRLEGSMVAIVTPMKDGVVDLRALRELAEWQLAEGTDGIVPCGTTGEGATLTPAERAEVIRAVVELVRGRALVIAGAGSNATHEAIEGVKAAKALERRRRPRRHALLQQAARRRGSTGTTSRSGRRPGSRWSPTTSRAARRGHAAGDGRPAREGGAIVGIKEATANMDRQVQLVERIGKDAIAYLSGDDFTVLPYIACGGHGVISVIANIAPRAMKELVVAARTGRPRPRARPAGPRWPS